MMNKLKYCASICVKIERFFILKTKTMKVCIKLLQILSEVFEPRLKFISKNLSKYFIIKFIFKVQSIIYYNIILKLSLS